MCNEIQYGLDAMQAAGLEDSLSDETATLTVLAPTDDAFGDIDRDTLEDLFDDPEKLAGVCSPAACTSQARSVHLVESLTAAPNGMAIAPIAKSKFKFTQPEPQVLISSTEFQHRTFTTTVLHSDSLGTAHVDGTSEAALTFIHLCRF